MPVKLKKVLNDLRSRPGRTGLVIVALIIGLWGVGSILVSYEVLSRDLNENFARTLPPHAILTSSEFDRLDPATLRALPEIESAEFRDLSLFRIESKPNEWIPLWLFGVSDFEKFQVARFFPQTGAVVPPPGTMLIERNGQLISSLRVGSRATVRVGSTIQSIPVSGICFDPAQAPATQDNFIYAYVDRPTYSKIAGKPANRRLLIRVRDAQNKQDVSAATDRIVQSLGASGIDVSSINIPEFLEHPHQWQLETLLFLQGGIGFLGFLLGAVLVAQLMGAILRQQIRQIGILKAIGASRGAVLRMYAMMILIPGVLAGIIATPLAVASGYAFSKFTASVLNFEILTVDLPFQIYGTLIATVVLLPLLVSLPALLYGTKVSVREALSDYGLARVQYFGQGGFLRKVPLSPALRMAFQNTGRQKKRMFGTVMAIALGTAIFSTAFNVRSSLQDFLSEISDSMKHDVQVVFSDRVSRDQALRPFRGLADLDRVELWNGGRGELQSRVVSTGDSTGIVALPCDSDLLNLRITAGRWIKKSEVPEIVMNQQARDLYPETQPGDSLILTISGKQVKFYLAGVVRELDKPKIYMDIDEYDRIANPEHLVNSVMFVAKSREYDRVIALKQRIEQALAASDLKVLYVMSQAERVKIIYDHLNIILTTLVFLALAVLLVSALGMAAATGINIMERTREIGVLRAIGATPRMIVNLFTAEGLILSVAGIGAGLLLAWPLSVLAGGFFGKLMLGKSAAFSYSFSAAGFWITLATTLLFGLLASRIPAMDAICKPAREALAYE